MADINDVATVIASALTEIGLHGYVDLEMDGAKRAASVGSLGDEVEVTVTVRLLKAMPR